MIRKGDEGLGARSKDRHVIGMSILAPIPKIARLVDRDGCPDWYRT